MGLRRPHGWRSRTVEYTVTRKWWQLVELRADNRRYAITEFAQHGVSPVHDEGTREKRTAIEHDPPGPMPPPSPTTNPC